jgi:O-antigen biosynthesis protein WbqP
MMVKRAFDLALAIVLLPFVAPLLFVAAIAVRLDSPGPAFFRQERVGRGRRPFMLIKLRTMEQSTRSVASHEVGAHQITNVGSILRRTKLDELPQLISVIKGDMSFVGPRPCLPSQTDLINQRERHGAFAVPPGITGPAQVAGVDMSTPTELAEIDGAYARNRSFLGDLGLIVRTAIGHGSGDAAAR